jgi:O-antigen/teichoic acid export membrane protein
MSTIKTYLPAAKNGAFVIAGKIAIFTISFGFMAFFGNVATKTTLGQYNYIISVLSIISIATLPGINSALVRAVSRDSEGSVKTLTAKRVTTGLIGTFACICIGAYYLLQKNTVLGYSFFIAAPFVPLTDTFSDIAILYWQGKKDFRKSTLVAVLYQLLFSIPSILILFLTENIQIIIASFLFFQSIAGYLVFRLIHAENTNRDPESENFGIHLSVMYAFRTLGINIDKLIVWFIFGPVSLAIYVFAITPINKLEQLIPIDQVALPTLSTMEFSTENKKKVFKKTIPLFFFVTAALIIGYFISPFFYKILFPAYPDSIVLFQLLLLSLLFSPLLLLKTTFTAWHKRRELYVLEILFPIVKGILIITLAFSCGILGVVYGVIISKLLDGLLTFLLFQRL